MEEKKMISIHREMISLVMSADENNEENKKEDTDEVKLKEIKEKNEIQRKKARYLRDAVYDSRAKMRRLKEEKKKQDSDKAYYEKSEKRQRGEYLDEKIKFKKVREECKLLFLYICRKFFISI